MERARRLPPSNDNGLVQPLLKSLTRWHGVGAERDHAGSRKLFYDQYVALLLLKGLTAVDGSTSAGLSRRAWAL